MLITLPLLLLLYDVVLPCRNPLAALELHIPAATLPPTMLDSAHRDREFEEEEEEEHNQVRAYQAAGSRAAFTGWLLTVLQHQ